MKISYALLCSFLLLAGCDAGTIGGPRQTPDPRVCLPETDAVFCARLDSDCGELVAHDNCGVSRTVASCGTCTPPTTCGGAGEPNVCGTPSAQGGLVISTALELSSTTVQAGDTLTGTVTYRNTSAEPIEVVAIVITLRSPGGALIEMSPRGTRVVVEPNATVSLSASYTLSPEDPRGAWTSFARWQDAGGVFIDGPAVSFTVITGPCVPETDAELCVRYHKNCDAFTAVDNCGVSRTVASCGTCDLPATCGGAGPPNLCGEPGTLVNPAPGIGFFVGANFWRIDWEGWDNYFVSGVDWATVENPWREDFLVDLSPYRVLRFMDWNLTNDLDNPQAHWSTRKQKTSSQLNEPIAFEWQIDLCNRTYKDYWITVPPEAEPSDWTELAELIYATLDPSLRVYVEWANEVWNGAFPVSEYAYGRASALSLPGNDGSLSYQAYQSVRLFEAFDAVFGETNPRLVRVISGQAAWTGVFEDLKDALADLTINPNATRPDFFAIAPYVHGTSIAELSGGLATAISWTASSYECASEGGFPLISYEGGTDSFSGDCTAMQHDEGIYDIYTGYLDGLVSSQMTGPFMQYTHSGECWGLKENTSDTLGVSPKYRAVTDWLVAHP